MSEYYTHFSEVLSDLTAEEETWLQHKLSYIYIFDDDKPYAKDDIPANLDRSDAYWSGPRVCWEDLDDDSDELGFDYEFHQNSEWGRYLSLYAEDSGDPERAAKLVQEFFKCFRSDQCWVLTYACTSSRCDPGDYGGGAIFVTATKMRRMDSHVFSSNQHDLFARQQTKNSSSRMTDMHVIEERARLAYFRRFGTSADVPSVNVDKPQGIVELHNVNGILGAYRITDRGLRWDEKLAKQLQQDRDLTHEKRIADANVGTPNAAEEKQC